MASKGRHEQKLLSLTLFNCQREEEKCACLIKIVKNTATFHTHTHTQYISWCDELLLAFDEESIDFNISHPCSRVLRLMIVRYISFFLFKASTLKHTRLTSPAAVLAAAASVKKPIDKSQNVRA